MIAVEQFNERATALYRNQQTMAGAKRWKSGKRAGEIRRHATPLTFDAEDLCKWLAKKVGLNAIPCPYCRTPIDILSLTLDHIVPRSLGGSFELDNLQCVCRPCNERKGKFSPQGFQLLIDFCRDSLVPYDSGVLMQRLRSAGHGFGSFRNKGKKKPDAHSEVFELPAF